MVQVLLCVSVSFQAVVLLLVLIRSRFSTLLHHCFVLRSFSPPKSIGPISKLKVTVYVIRNVMFEKHELAVLAMAGMPRDLRQAFPQEDDHAPR